MTFEIPGKITSANKIKTPFAGNAIKTKSARNDTERIRGIAFVAKIAQGWVVPERARMFIYAFNSRLDAGNVEKVVSDSIKGGLLIVDDNPKHLKSLFVEHQDKDKGGERYVVELRPA